MKKFFTLIAVAAMAFAAQANELTVCEAEMAYNTLPVYGYWYDVEGIGQMIYPADMLTEMAGGQITALKFYTPAAYWGDDFAAYTVAFSGGNIQLSLKEVDQIGFEEAEIVTGATVVASIVPVSGDLYLTFELNEPFQYNGGNLLVEAAWDGEGSYGRTYFVAIDELNYNPCYYGFDYYGEWSESLCNYLPMATFTYEPGTEPGPGPEPTEMTAAPVFNGYTTDGIHAYFVEIMETEPSTIYYRVFVWDADNNEWVVYGEEDWTEYTEILSFAGDGKYRVEAYAVAENKLPSYDIAYEFTVSPLTGLSELTNGKTVSSVRYFNVAGQEMQEANGLTIVVTTYTDGTTSTAKVIK